MPKFVRVPIFTPKQNPAKKDKCKECFADFDETTDLCSTQDLHNSSQDLCDEVVARKGGSVGTKNVGTSEKGPDCEECLKEESLDPQNDIFSRRRNDRGKTSKGAKTPIFIPKRSSREVSKGGRCDDFFGDRSETENVRLMRDLYDEGVAGKGKRTGIGSAARSEKVLCCEVCLKGSLTSQSSTSKNKNDRGKVYKTAKTPIFVPKQSSGKNSKRDGCQEPLKDCTPTEKPCPAQDSCNERSTRKSGRTGIASAEMPEKGLGPEAPRNSENLVSSKNRKSRGNKSKVAKKPTVIPEQGTSKISSGGKCQECFRGCGKTKILRFAQESGSISRYNKGVSRKVVRGGMTSKGNKALSCEMCCKGSRKACGLKGPQSTSSKHTKCDRSSRPRNIEMAHQCGVCDKRFAFSHTLMSHLRTHQCAVP